LEKYEGQLPKSNTPLRVQLDLISHSNEKFKPKLISYMKPLLLKGVPSLINDLGDYYEDAGKIQVIGDILEGF